MRALIQRVSSASVTVDGRVTGEIGAGSLVLVCVMQGDTETQSTWLARKVANLRIFEDAEGRMNRSLIDVGGSALVVSQFTLAAETKASACTSISQRHSPVTACRSPTESSAPTWMWRWSTTAR